MDRRNSSPSSPRTLPLNLRDSACKSDTPSPCSEAENRRITDDLDKYKEISEFMKEIDDILDFMKPFPRRNAEDERERASTSSTARPISDNKGDHLENLIRLVEQLKNLKEKNYESRRMKARRKSKSGESGLPPPPPDPPERARTSLPFRRNSRSKSISVQSYLPAGDRSKPLSHMKSKISKWTKVKEAFRWERASQLDPKTRKIDKKESSQCQETSASVAETGQRTFLKVPERPSATPSPADSVLSANASFCSSMEAASSSGLLTTSGYSGEPSCVTHSHSSVCLSELGHRLPISSFSDHHSHSLQELSSSSGDEKPEEVIVPPTHKDFIASRKSEDNDSRRSKSLDGDTILGPSPHLFHEFQDEDKPSKSKTPWGKVIEIIHTRKDSLMRKPKKWSDEVDCGRVSCADWQACEDATSSPDEPHTPFALQGPTIEVTADKDAPNSSHFVPSRPASFHLIRPLTPVLMLTRPSTEELRNFMERNVEKPAEERATTPPNQSEEDGKQDSQAPDDPVLSSSSSSAIPSSARSSRWVRVKKAFLTSSNPDDATHSCSSAPSSPFLMGTFFSEDSGEELSSGEWSEAKRDNYQYPEVVAEIPDLPKSGLSQESEIIQSASKPDEIPKRPRESLSIPLPTVNDLSPEFKKKLDEWKKIKKTPTTPPFGKEETQGHFKTRIGEWQRWRPGSGNKSESQQMKQEHHIQDEFYKKLEEWQMLKASKRSRSQSEKGKYDREYRTPSPAISRKNSKTKKVVTSGKSSGCESQGGSIKEKDGRAGRKTQKEKDLQWLEKELNKIEREKLRLEREKEKYLEREARLEQMKRTMGTTTPSQEVLIQTATGFFRFEGISQKFTEKLYEWEKARGIAPEASTFALLEKACLPSREDRPGLQRSKSVGSAIDSSSAAALSGAHHPSSLSLNDVDDLEALEQASILDTVRMSDENCAKEEDEPEALIVDVEDIIEETAAMLVDEPQVQEQVPVYSYAPAEVTRLIDSSESDGEREAHVLESYPKCRRSQIEPASLIEENIHLLNKLEENEEVFRGIENEMDKMDITLVGVEDKEKCFLVEGDNLQHSFMKHSGEQEEIVHSLVDKMRILHEANTYSSRDRDGGGDDVSQVIELSSQLVDLAQRLETALNKRHTDLIHSSRNWCWKKDKARMNRIGAGKMWLSVEEENPSVTSTPAAVEVVKSECEVGDLSSMIASKVAELKTGLKRLRQTSEGNVESEVGAAPVDATTDEIEAPDNFASFTFRLTKAPTVRKFDTDLFGSDEGADQRRKIRNRRGKSPSQVTTYESAAEGTNMNLQASTRGKEQRSPEVLKKRIKDKILELQRLANEPRGRCEELKSRQAQDQEYATREEKNLPDDSKVVTVKRDEYVSHSKNLKARRITDTAIAYQSQQNSSEMKELSGTTPTFVFVPTSRKIISPVQTDDSSSVLRYVMDDIEPSIAFLEESTPEKSSSDNSTTQQTTMKDIGAPPLSASPCLSRKFDKETAPSIRMMIAKYNRSKMDCQESTEEVKSPSAWRSPILVRKIKEQMAKFEDDGTSILKHGGKFGSGEVLKSASTGLLKMTPSQISPSNAPRIGENNVSTPHGVLKSSSLGAVKLPFWTNQSSGDALPPKPTALPPPSVVTSESCSMELRAQRIRQAKAEFLAKGPGSQSYTSDTSQTPTSINSGFLWQVPKDKHDSACEEMKARNRLSHASGDSEVSFDEASFGDVFPTLIKSASAGMLDAARMISHTGIEDNSIQKTASTSLVSGAGPDSSLKEKKSSIFNIKSRFRKVKLRKGKEKEKESAVQTLVRQSLALGGSSSDSAESASTRDRTCVEAGAEASQSSRSCPASPILERTRAGTAAAAAHSTSKWSLHRTRLFQSKERKRLSGESAATASGDGR